MPSPFPGMDPYLEHAAIWPGVHQGLITYMQAALNTLLPPHYVADIGERLYVVQPESGIYPDVVVIEHPPVSSSAGQGSISASETAVSDPPWILTLHPVEMREVFVEILAIGDESRVVTVIEVLSPSNKTAGTPGRDLYLTKRNELLKSQTHLIEIDFLHYGEHTVAPPRERLLEQGTWDYLVSLHRGGQGYRYEVWAVTLRQRLPRIRVPLAPGDPDVVLDLQRVFDRCYDAAAYARRLDYHREPPIALRQDDAAWVAALLRERGLRV
jgi:hypothetical protein